MDILIDEHSLVFEAGDFVLIDGILEVKQQIVVALNTLLEEWALDVTRGINYAALLRDSVLCEYFVKKQILAVSGVNSLENLEINFEKNNMTISVKADVNTDYGNVSLNEFVQIL